MAILAFLIALFGATMLLLYAVRMVGTGIERAMGPGFRRLITDRRDNRLGMTAAGVVLATVLQSATAATLLAAGFAASGLISFAGALSLVLGADFGSAVVIQLLSLRPDWLIPLLLGAGGWLFLKTERRLTRQIGRILIGIALILLSLRLISDAVQPIRDAAFLPAIAGYLERDAVSAFLAGAVITFAMHSSVGAILTFVTFVHLGVLPVAAGAAMVLGANLGSAFLPIWLGRGMDEGARRIFLGNLLLRGIGAVLALALIRLTPALELLQVFSEPQQVVSVHMTFNALLVVLTLPLVPLLDAPLRALLPDPPETADSLTAPPSALDRSVLDRPRQALGCLRREVLRMGQLIETMARPVMEIYANPDKEAIRRITAMDAEVNAMLEAIRRYSAAIDTTTASKDERRRIRELTEYAINLESAGDIIAKRLMALAREKGEKGLKLSDEGWAELRRLHERVLANMALAFNVLVSDDLESARLLVAEKAEMKAAERKSRKKHLSRLRKGLEQSFESSDLHLETLRWLNDLNSQITAVAYPLLYRSGQLLETRLVHELDRRQMGGDQAG